MFFHRFVVPSKSDTEGFSPAGIVEEYLNALHDQFPDLPKDSRLFIRGDPAKGDLPSKFRNQPIGETMLGHIPRFIAEFLKLPNLSGYKSHSLRRTSATLSAEGGATVQQMKVNFAFIHLIMWSKTM